VKVIPKMLRKIAFHLLVMIMMADGRKRRQRRHHGRHEFKAFSGDMRNTTCERGWATCHVRQVERFGKARFFSQCGQDQFAFEHLGLRRLKGSRYFVEMGARNGLDDSNTLFYEETLGWRGLLVEAQPAFYEHLSRNRPRAHVLHGAIGRHSNCTFNDVRMANGMIEPGWSGLTPQNVPKGAALAPYPVRCYELAPVLRLLKMQRVDYFSLDVEGSELAVLESIDWGQVNIGGKHPDPPATTRSSSRVAPRPSTHCERLREWHQRIPANGRAAALLARLVLRQYQLARAAALGSK
jgi:FkbM family methyltransferase